MKNFSIFIFAIFIFFATNIFSQQKGETVYLKNGSIIHGVIIEQIPNVSIKIQTTDGNVFVYKMDEIEKITYGSSNSNYNSNYSFGRKGLFNLWRIGIMTAGSISASGTSTSMDQSVFAISSIVGRRLSDIFRLGFGIEYDNYTNGTTVPLYMDFRFNILKNQVTPILFLDVGYSLAWIKNISGMNGDGFFLNVGSGVEFALNNTDALFVELSYKRQWSEITVTEYGYYDNYNYYYTYSNNIKAAYGFLSIMFGYTF